MFGSRRPRDPEMERAFAYEGDHLGAQSWALQHGWTISDGSALGNNSGRVGSVGRARFYAATERKLTDRPFDVMTEPG